MTGPRIVRFADTPPSRWANGLGATVELWRTPAEGEFTTRLSIATVDRPSPFSPLPGVARALMALAPAGLVLAVDGTRVPLARYETVAFAGDQDVAAIEVPEPGHDLNLMARGAVPELLAIRVDGRAELAPDALAAVVLEGDLTALGVRLGIGDAVLGGGVAIRGTGVVAVAATR